MLVNCCFNFLPRNSTMNEIKLYVVFAFACHHSKHVWLNSNLVSFSIGLFSGPDYIKAILLPIFLFGLFYLVAFCLLLVFWCRWVSMKNLRLWEVGIPFLNLTTTPCPALPHPTPSAQPSPAQPSPAQPSPAQPSPYCACWSKHLLFFLLRERNKRGSFLSVLMPGSSSNQRPDTTGESCV